eukprot:m.467375 g.467375  ORF g.467375 m.467375 type:complete len:247 (+) comp57063_c1_seq36:222-962(+)
MPGGGPLVLLLLGLALAAPLRPAHPPDKTKLELDGKINSLVAELTIKAHRRDYVKKTPEFPLFDPPPFSDTPRDQPVCSEADAAFVCVLQSNHRHIHGVVYVFHGVGMPPTDWFQLADRDALLDKLNLVGFHVVIPKASYKLQWEFTNDTRHIQGKSSRVHRFCELFVELILFFFRRHEFLPSSRSSARGYEGDGGEVRLVRAATLCGRRVCWLQYGCPYHDHGVAANLRSDSSLCTRLYHAKRKP